MQNQTQRGDVIVPIVLFAYARPTHLQRTLDCLRENKVPLIYAFSDGPRSPDKAASVEQVRKILREIDWCEVVLCEREENWGLGRSILSGVTEVLQSHEMCIVYEDDLICIPGTYQYLAATMNHYRDDARVMSVTGWTHPAVTPSDVTDQPYFDGRAECWVWGTWARAWNGIMEHTAADYVRRIEQHGGDIAEYGADIVGMAAVELKSNIWAVRLLYHHLVNNGLCLRPPYTMVQHIGAGLDATNVGSSGWSDEAVLTTCPPHPARWPEPMLNPDCAALWRYMTSPAHLAWNVRIQRRLASLFRKAGSILGSRLT